MHNDNQPVVPGSVAVPAPIDVPCCPPLGYEPCSDKLQIRYSLPFRPSIQDRRVPVEVIFVFEFERCSCGLRLGDLQHTFSLMPGEDVRLFTADKSTRWSYDKETELSYRHERTSSESHFTFGFARAVSDLDISSSGSSESDYEEDWSQGGGGASLNLGFVSIGGGGGGGSYSAQSSSEFARNLSRHAEASSSYVAASVRASRAVSIGEVETRTHAEGESEQSFEASTRHVRNNNYCHAVSYYVWQIMKCQRIRWRLVAIEKYVDDQAAPTSVTQAARLKTQVSVVPQTVLATSTQRLEVEHVARQSAIERLADSSSTVSAKRLSAFARVSSSSAFEIDNDTRRAALAAVQAELEHEGLVKNDGTPTEHIRAQLSWEQETLLPTGGLMIKGCLDECNVCDDLRIEEVKADIERKRLENKLLEKKIELLEKHSDYRCCPVGEAVPDA